MSPRRYLYLLNADHVAVDAIRRLALLTNELSRRIRDDVRAWVVPPTWVGVRYVHDTRRHSADPVIIALVPPPEPLESAWSYQSERLVRRVRRWSGSPAAAVEMMSVPPQAPDIVDGFETLLPAADLYPCDTACPRSPPGRSLS